MTRRKIQLIWAEGILEKHFRLKDLDITLSIQNSYNPREGKHFFVE